MDQIPMVGFDLARYSARLLLYPYVTLSVCSNPEAVCNLLYSVGCYRRCQWCICVLSLPWWSGLAEGLDHPLYNTLGWFKLIMYTKRSPL